MALTEELQKAFCKNTAECSEDCRDCIFHISNFEHFKQRFNDLKK